MERTGRDLAALRGYTPAMLMRALHSLQLTTVRDFAEESAAMGRP
jgi:hypothetical protein